MPLNHGLLGWLRQSVSACKRRLWKPKVLPRHEYKQVWNALSSDETHAKLAVAGHIDELKLLRTAEYTVQLLQQMVGVHATDVVLEIGAGVGRVGQVLSPLCQKWIATDVSTNMLAILRRRLAQRSNIETVELNGYDLSPIAPASVDLVYCTVVFMHLDEWDRFNYIREAFRVLKPGGRLWVDNFNLLSEEGWQLFESLCQLPPHQRPAQISKSSTPQELQVYFRKAGFTHIGQQESGMWCYTFGTKPQ